MVLVTLMNVMAAENALSMKVIGERTFQITVDNVIGEAHIKIVDREGITLYTSGVKHEGAYSKIFDASNLPMGSYYLEIADEFKTETLDLNISKEVTLNLEQAKTQLNPMITISGDRMSVALHALEQEKMTISFYDEASNALGRYILKGTGYIAQKFRFESLNAGTYKVVVEHKGRIFSKQLTML